VTEPAVRTPAAAPTEREWAELGAARFISLVTFRKSGAAVPTTVWVAPEGDSLVVTTPAGSGKVKRLRNSGRVQLSISGRMGRVAADAFVVEALCEIVGPEGQHPAAVEAFKDKYGFEYRFVLAIERRAKRRRLRKGEPLHERLILRITRSST